MNTIQNSNHLEKGEMQISQLEDLYAEALKEEMDIYTLNSIWTRIKHLKHQWNKEKNWNYLKSI
jgi:hypothetical protein